MKSEQDTVVGMELEEFKGIHTWKRPKGWFWLGNKITEYQYQ